MANLIIRRNNATVAIDSNYFNLGLRQKGTLIASEVPNQEAPATKRGEITLNSDQGMIAYRASHPAALILARPNGNGTTTYTFFGVNANGNVTIDWWLFDLPEYSMQFAGAKFIIRRPVDGRIAFDSRNKYMKTLEFFRNTANETLTKQYDKYPAVIMVNRAWANTARAMPGAQNQVLNEIRSSCCWVGSGNLLNFGSMTTFYKFNSSTAPQFSYNGGAPYFMVIDVANY